ncbi:hypothetical protein FDECE_3465 [Fusarium decemcellulare]|nr:hypothetical protein FDECE_3465 [Fusarium decemcellulare]
MKALTEYGSQCDVEAEKLTIINNDLPDSDNWAAVLVALAQALPSMEANGRVLIIVEARQASLTRYMTAAERKDLLDVIEKSGGKCGREALKILLNGFPKDHDYTDAFDTEPLSSDKQELLRKIERPDYDPLADAEKHTNLVALDFASYIAKHASDWRFVDADGADRDNIEILIDYDGLGRIDNPVNPNAHHRDDLFGREEAEIKDFKEMITLHGKPREHAARKYYEKSIKRKTLELENSGVTIAPLVRTSLYERIKAAKSVDWFGGCSLTLLRDIHQEGLAAKLACHVQAGTLDLSSNMFPEQFNIALNRDAARYVFQHHADFGDFWVVPSHSAQAVKYSLPALLKLGGEDLDRRILGFNFGEDAVKIMRQPGTFGTEHHAKAVCMPDLTALLCMIASEKLDLKVRHVRVKNAGDKGEPLLFEYSDSNLDMKLHHLENLSEPFDISSLVVQWVSGS